MAFDDLLELPGVGSRHEEVNEAIAEDPLVPLEEDLPSRLVAFDTLRRLRLFKERGTLQKRPIAA